MDNLQLRSTEAANEYSSDGPTTHGRQNNAHPEQQRQHTWLRWLLLLFILIAFARLCWHLDANDMWWDESLSLQRAESDWWTLARGTLTMYDGFQALPTTDQHPFFFFILQGILIRLAGTSEFVLRFPATAAATLFVPVVWVLARTYERRAILLPTTAFWATGFAAIHPFFLWFGQEARPYTLWATTSLLAIYLLLRATDGPPFVQEGHVSAQPTRDVPPTRRRTINFWLIGYVIVTLISLVTHYYAIFWLPLHALHIYVHLVRRNRWLGPTIAMLIMAIGGVIGAVVAWQILSQGGGANFPEITLRILIPDLVNAFSLGLSVTLDNPVHWLGWIFGALTVVGSFWSMRSWRYTRAGGWLLPLGVLIPIVFVLLLNNFLQSPYMNARHLSVLGGAIILLVSGGIAVLWQRQRWGAGVLAGILVAGLLYSTASYYTKPAFGKDDYSGMGRYLQANLLPHDVVILSPPFSWRIFDYYLPLDEIERAKAEGRPIAYFGAPLLNQPWPETERFLADLQQRYRRIWLARSGTHPYLDLEKQVPSWLRENSTMRLREEKFFSPTSFLDLELFLTHPPVYEGLEPPAKVHIDLLFGDLIRLVGYDIDEPLQEGGALPITLYWQVEKKPDQRYKYVLQLANTDDAGAMHVLAHTEIEPYYGQIPTTFWDPGKTIIEYTSLPPVLFNPAQASQYRLTLQLYDAESLEKLPVTHHSADIHINGEQRAVFPFIFNPQ
ncbi:MAG TPA: glycosyltransferase family 39 protein [Caldilineaceae bacterium]|nr:glycosyltransferase family 39 protein [Caldilineaceae bacterium]